MKTLLYICLLSLCGVAEAAKLKVQWVNPSKNTDGSDLTDLAYVMIEWGSCNGIDFGTLQDSLIVGTTEAGKTMSAFIYPIGLSKVCIRAQAFSQNNASDFSAVVSKVLLPSTGKPVTLGQPVIIPFVPSISKQE